MSRTYKDEPYWVKKHNKLKYDTYACHNHYFLGFTTSGTRQVYRYVETGEPYYQKQTKLTPVFASEYHKYDTETLKPFLSFGGSSVIYYHEEEHFIKKQNREIIWELKEVPRIQGPKECNFQAKNTPTRPDKLHWPTEPCSEEIVGWQLGKRETYSNRPDKYGANLHHRSRRARHHIEQKKMVKLYNSGEDLYDFNYEGLRQRTHEGWWD